MAVIRALRQVPGALGRNPVIFVVLGAFGLLQAPQLLAQTVNPLLASVLSLLLSLVFVFVVPFVQAGLVGMADEALDGRTDVGTFVRAGKEFYLSVLGAYFVIVALSFVLGIVAFFGAIFGGLLAFGGETAGLVALVLIGGVLLLVTFAYLLFVLFVQFYGQEIVLDGASALEGLKRSVGLVRRNLVSTVGYTLVVVVLSGVLGLVAGLVSVAFQPAMDAGGTPPAMGAPQLSLTGAAVLLVVYVLGSALVGGVLLTYSVAFYREIRDRTGPSPSDGPGAGDPRAAEPGPN